MVGYKLEDSGLSVVVPLPLLRPGASLDSPPSTLSPSRVARTCNPSALEPSGSISVQARHHADDSGAGVARPTGNR